MIHDGITLISGTSIANMKIEEGTSLPGAPFTGQWYRLTQVSGNYSAGAYFYDGSAWVLANALTATSSINAQTGTTYTFVDADGVYGYRASKVVTFSNAAAQTVTVPPNSSVAFPVGTRIDCIALGAGKVTFAQGAGVTISSKDGNKAINGQYSAATLFKTATDTWILVGSLTA